MTRPTPSEHTPQDPRATPEAGPSAKAVREAAPLAIESLSADERIALIGQLWDSLEPSEAAPISAELAAELARREAEADADPDGGVTWEALQAELRARIR